MKDNSKINFRKVQRSYSKNGRQSDRKGKPCHPAATSQPCRGFAPLEPKKGPERPSPFVQIPPRRMRVEWPLENGSLESHRPLSFHPYFNFSVHPSILACFPFLSFFFPFCIFSFFRRGRRRCIRLAIRREGGTLPSLNGSNGV